MLKGCWLVDGVPGRLLQPDDRGLQYGDGLFETIAIRNGTARFLDRHLARLHEGCLRLGLPAPDGALLADEIGGILEGAVQGTVKVILTRGTSTRGYRPPAECTSTRLIGFWPEWVPEVVPDQGVVVRMCRTPASLNAVTAGLKTLNRLENVLARAEWRDQSVAEGLMCDAEQRVVGGTMSNLFVVRGGRLTTPTLTHSGVRGVMRGVIIEEARRAGFVVDEDEIAAADLIKADEMFLSNSLIGIWPVSQFAGRLLEPGLVTRMVAALLGDLGVSECGWARA
jgi:4-amino-4-deoxychorismate lyase